MHKYKQYTRLFVFSIIAFIFLFPIIYLIVFSVFHSDTGFSLMNYYKVFLAKPDYLIKFWRSLATVSYTHLIFSHRKKERNWSCAGGWRVIALEKSE